MLEANRNKKEVVVADDADEADDVADDADEPDNVLHRDLVIVGDYGSCVQYLTVDSKETHSNDEAPFCLLAVSEGEVSEDAPKARVWAIGFENVPKYWNGENSGLPQMVADELFNRMLDEGDESVPVGEFIEEACNEHRDSILVVERSFFLSKLHSFRSMLHAKRGTAQRVIRFFYTNYVNPRSTKKIAQVFTQTCTTLDEATNIS